MQLLFFKFFYVKVYFCSLQTSFSFCFLSHLYFYLILIYWVLIIGINYDYFGKISENFPNSIFYPEAPNSMFYPEVLLVRILISLSFFYGRLFWDQNWKTDFKSQYLGIKTLWDRYILSILMFLKLHINTRL